MPLTHIEALEFDRLPEHLIVLGGGYVGLEFTQAYRRFGSRFTVVEHGPRLAGLLTGAAFGAGAGALSGALSDYGIDDEFIRSLGSTIQPGSSALFILVRRATLDKVLPELRPFGGTVLRMSLSHEQEEHLKKALQDVNVNA